MSSTESAQLACKPIATTNQTTNTQTQPPVKPKKQEEALYKVVSQDKDKGLILERTKKEEAGEETEANLLEEPAPQLSPEIYMENPVLNFEAGIPYDLNSILFNSLTSDMPKLNFQTLQSKQTEAVDEKASPFDLAYRKLMREYNDPKSKMSYEDFIKKYEQIKEDAAEEVEGDESIAASKADAARYNGLTEAQVNMIKTLRNSGFTRENFKADDRIPGAITTTQEIKELNKVISTTILPNGDKLVTETDKDKEGFLGALKGERGGIGTRLVGATEIAAGIVGWATSPFSAGITAVGGTALIADGIRRLKNSFTGGTAYTATLTKSNGGAQETIQHNYKDGFFSKVFKKIGILN